MKCPQPNRSPVAHLKLDGTPIELLPALMAPPEMVVLIGTVPYAATAEVAKCLGVYTKRKEVNERRPTYIKMDGQKNRVLWYHNQRWRFGVLDDRNRHDCDICCDDDASFSPENVGSSWRARVSGLDFQVAPEMRLHALLPEMRIRATTAADSARLPERHAGAAA